MRTDQTRWVPGERAARVRGWLEPRLEHLRSTLRDTVLLRSVARMYEIDGRNRTMMLAGQAFIATVPLLIVVATLASSSDGAAVGNQLVDDYGLTGSAAASVRTLFARPPGATGGLSLLGLVVLLVALGALARLLQQTYLAAWKLRASGARARLKALYGTLLLIAGVAGLDWVADLAGNHLDAQIMLRLLELALAVPVWVLVIWLMLAAQVPARALIPGAVVSAVGQVLVEVISGLYVPHLIEANTERYGVIGASFALVSWLVVASYLIVVSAVIGAELGSRSRWLTAGPRPAAGPLE